MLSEAKDRKFFPSQISTEKNKLWRKFTSLCPKPSEKWYFPDKIWGSTEKKTHFWQKKALKSAFVTISAWKKKQWWWKKCTKTHMCFLKALCTTPDEIILSRVHGNKLRCSHLSSQTVTVTIDTTLKLFTGRISVAEHRCVWTSLEKDLSFRWGNWLDTITFLFVFVDFHT